MPNFQYEAVDGRGKPWRGEIEGATPSEVRQTLQRRGFQQVTIRVAQATAPVARPTPVAAPSTAPPAPTVNRTRLGTDKERFFLLTQFAAALRAGIAPQQAALSIGQNAKPVYRRSLDEISAGAQHGEAISAVMERWPDLYPEGVVNLVRAGELGGFLPDAMQKIADQQQNAHKFKRWFFWIWFIFLNALLGVPGMIWTSQSLVGMYDAIEKQGRPMPLGEALASNFRVLGQYLMWPHGPAFALLCLACYALWRWAGARITRPLRHRLGITFPVYGPRARHENLELFAWTLARVSRSGLSPRQAYELSSRSVPNDEMRERLLRIGNKLGDGTPLSHAFAHEGIFPDEFAPMVHVAEITGDLPGTFQALANASQAEFETAQAYAKARSGCWGALGCFVTSGIMLGVLMYAWYHQLPARILDGFEP